MNEILEPVGANEKKSKVLKKKNTNRTKSVLRILLFLSPAIVFFIYVVFVSAFRFISETGFNLLEMINIFSVMYFWLPLLIPLIICFGLYILAIKRHEIWSNILFLVVFSVLYGMTIIWWSYWSIGWWRHSDEVWQIFQNVIITSMTILFIFTLIFFTIESIRNIKIIKGGICE